MTGVNQNGKPTVRDVIQPDRAPSAHIVGLREHRCAEAALVGGKGANLGRLAAAGLPVPEAFVVTADGYREFIAANDLTARIYENLSRVDHNDLDLLDSCCTEIRSIIAAAPFPTALEDAIRGAYSSLGATPYVAVRSSGTAEDLADSSFAGQHDTYLDVVGVDRVLEAVRRCFASLWTTRAVAYRAQRGFGNATIALPVVVQVMVESDCSGVLFTANPLTGAVDEYVVNASWGLGEGIVSGILEPDQVTLARDTLQPVSRTLGSKAVEIVRDEEHAFGTVTREVSAERRQRYCLDDAALRSLGQLGRRVTDYYQNWPQDIEWAIADGRLYLLQSRDVTGVEFDWDCDLDDWKQTDPPPADTLWSNVWAREIWCGRITPLMYSIRGEALTVAHTYSANMWGYPDVGRLPLFKYSRGTVYFNSRTDYLNHINTVPPALRTGAVMPFVPPIWFENLENEPFDWIKFVKFFVRLQMIDKVTAPYAWMKNAFWKEANQKEYFAGLSIDEIRALSDRELRKYAQETITRQAREYIDAYTGLFVHVPLVSAAMIWFLGNYYTGSNHMIFTDLITGLPQRTLTQSMNLSQLTLANAIKADSELLSLFENSAGADFFANAASNPRFASFTALYEQFLVEYGHRGHADRDIWYDRRCENPQLDYDALRTLLQADDVDHEATERRLIAQREAAAAEVIEGLRGKPLAALKIEAFKLLHDYLLRFFTWRDNERNHADRGTLAKKRAFQEIGRRLSERGVLTDADAGDDGKDLDFYYLAKDELFRLLEGATADLRLVHAKVASRRRNCERVGSVWSPPMYLAGNEPIDLEAAEDLADVPEGTLLGTGTSRGTTRGTARVIAHQSDLGRLRKGDILVTNATDPGWTPAFLLISGLVLETGGMLAHGSCISREYGIPAVVVPGAMSKIPDGATLTVSGEVGRVLVEPVPAVDPATVG